MGRSMTTKSKQSAVGIQFAVPATETSTGVRGGEATTMQTEKENDKDKQQSEPTVDESIQGHLGRKLKAVYDDLVRQPVPEKFHQLLEELERREKPE
jgi:Anti-sigma factor NepR